jgi:hexosaminidase
MKRSLIFLIAAIFASSCNQMKQNNTSEKSSISLTWSFQGNNAEQGYYSAAFVLENLGEAALPDQGWALYYNQQGLGVIDESVSGNVKIIHINGDLLKIVPLEGFRLDPGASVEIAYRKPGSMLLQSESPLHPYMVFESDEEGKPDSVAVVDYSLLPFPSLEQFYPEAMNIVLPDASWVFEQNRASTHLDEWETGLVIPTPVREAYGEETINLNKNLTVYFQEGLDTEAGYLSDLLKQVRGSAPTIQQGTEGGTGMIILHIDEQIGKAESYQVLVDAEKGIVIVGSDRAGVFYGIQTFFSMIPLKAWANPEPGFELKAAYIADRPAFSYRGFHLDIARNFIEPDDIKKLIRAMAYYKLNKLHLHMTDDEGWRLEIPSIPELTELGAHRGHTLDERDHLIPAYGSGPDPDPEGNHGSGYLSRDRNNPRNQFSRSCTRCHLCHGGKVRPPDERR